ncbi:MAG: hypothetical protein N4A36_04370 [Candidatus Gracilibacteria bacterium]|jgi:hypothetical protein|nr:hypothetical protein [Candidatus Gracilibacteria bacterium]
MQQRAKEIVQKAWEITNNHKYLLKYGFWPSFFGILVGGVYTFYQIQAFMHSPLFSNHKTDYGMIFSHAKDFVSDYPWVFLFLLISTFLVLFCYFIIPVICSGALIHMISKIAQGKKPKEGLTVGLFRFLPMLETSAAKSTMKPVSFFTEWSFVIRNLGPGRAVLVTPFLIFFAFVGIVILFFFALTSQFIVLKNQNFSESIVGSSKFVIRNFKTTFSLFLIFILIELRVILNIAVILFLPVAVFWITGIFADIFNLIGILIAGVVAFCLITLTALITGTLSVFSHAIWTLAFLEFQSEED